MPPDETSASAQKRGRLERLERQKKQIENKIKAIHARENEKTRKARTRRLIQLGALAETYFDCSGIEPAQFEELLKKVVAALGQEKTAEPAAEEEQQKETV